jgi:hypothetical protein
LGLGLGLGLASPSQRGQPLSVIHRSLGNLGGEMTRGQDWSGVGAGIDIAIKSRAASICFPSFPLSTAIQCQTLYNTFSNPPPADISVRVRSLPHPLRPTLPIPNPNHPNPIRTRLHRFGIRVPPARRGDHLAVSRRRCRWEHIEGDDGSSESW